MWDWFVDSFAEDYSPLYHRIATSVANDPEVLELVGRAPPPGHFPLTLMAAVHYLVLGDLDHPLADIYAGRSDADPAPLFRDVCLSHQDEILELLGARSVQTNEVGRSALIGPALTLMGQRFKAELHVVDVGASAGLNLCCDRYRLDYGAAGASGPERSPVRIDCAVWGGNPPVVAQLGPFASRQGLDLDPPDLTDPTDVRWLLACVWPDTGRLERLRHAIAVAATDPPLVRRGDAVRDLPLVLEALETTGVVCLLSTWSFSYLSVEHRARFIEQLQEWGRRRPVVWIAGDFAGLVDLVDPGPDVTSETQVLTAVIFDGSGLHPELLARVHPHGFWLDWQA